MRRRSGFTLVEVLVSMALILFIMSILTAAFVAATQTFSDLKASGDLAEKLRAATTVLHSDLAAYHVLDSNGNPAYLRNLWRPGGAYNAASPPPPPSAGFFRLFQGGAPQLLNGGVPGSGQNFVDGTDVVDSVPSFLSTNHVLHYTIILTGTKRSDFLSAFINPAANPSPLLNASDAVLGPPDQRYEDTPNTANPQVYNSQTAEVAVFLSPEADPSTGAQATTDGTPIGTPLYGLFRRQFLTVPGGWAANLSIPGTNQSSYTEMSNFIPTSQTNLYFNTMQDLTMPVKRFGMDRTNLAGVAAAGGGYQPIGNASDLLLNDVVSFDVQLLVAGASDFGNLHQLTGQGTPSVGITFTPNNSQFPANGGAQVFDTWAGPPPDPSNPAYDYTTWNTPGQLNSVPIYLSNETTPQPISIRAVQITLRVWDFKTKKTRQVTMVQQV